MSGQSPGPLRALAPIALVVFGIVFLIVVFASLSSGPEEPVAPVDLGVDQSKVKKVKTDDSLTGVSETDTATEATTGEFGSTTDELGTDTTGTTISTTKETYTVKPGDTLEGISAKTGVSVDELRTMNPDVDPQALVSGSKLTLTE